MYTPFNQPKLPMYMQSEASECALACIAMIASAHGANMDLLALRQRFGLSLRGASLATVLQTADAIGLACRSVKVPLNALEKLRTPAILHWEFNHFVVLDRYSNGTAVIHDPAVGIRRCALQELSDSFTGVAVEMAATDYLRDFPKTASNGLTALWRNSRGLGLTLAQIVLLSIILQLFLVLSPLYLQIVIDEVLPNANVDLLVTLALGFGLFTILNAVADAVRSFVLIHSGACLSFQFATNLFFHLTRLPLDFFEKRHVGDILSRFGSLDPIKEALIQGVASTLIDSLMLLVTLLLMLLYSPKITLIVVIASLLYGAVRMALYYRLRRLSEAAIAAKAKEQSLCIETLRGMLPLKVFCREPERRQKWQNLLATSISAEAELAKTQMWFSLANTLLFGLENIAVVYSAASAVMDTSFTLGMLFAFMTYKRQFVDKSSKLLEVIIDFKMLGLHFDRLADIQSSPAEVSAPAPVSRCEFAGQIALHGVSYTYSADQENVLTDINLSIPAGQRVALTGRSGCGKTTLIKVLLGLLSPTTGEVRADNTPLARFGVLAYRRSVAAIMQEDELFTGSIAENIAFFDSAPDAALIHNCAEQAAIYNDIVSMPMGFETLVGDMGSSLSGGQKQRLLLARALYARPSLLVLDEGTAHLDAATETAINQTLQQLNITVISVAHRERTIGAADRVVTMTRGRIVNDKIQVRPNA